MSGQERLGRNLIAYEQRKTPPAPLLSLLSFMRCVFFLKGIFISPLALSFRRPHKGERLGKKAG